MNYETKKKKQAEYDKIKLHFRECTSSPEEIDKMAAYLLRVGVYLYKDPSGNTEDAYLCLLADEYMNAVRETAGRIRRLRKKPATAGSDGPAAYSDMSYWRYSDLARFIADKLPDAEVMKKLDMKPATYYRHKKTFRESEYFSNLDLSRAKEPGYLESLRGNSYF